MICIKISTLDECRLFIEKEINLNTKLLQECKKAGDANGIFYYETLLSIWEEFIFSILTKSKNFADFLLFMEGLVLDCVRRYIEILSQGKNSIYYDWFLSECRLILKFCDEDFGLCMLDDLNNLNRLSYYAKSQVA